MSSKDKDLPLIVITGPTASGKTSLAIEIAKKCNGEIICADSRTVYKYLDIGTAKPTKKEQSEVKHWGIDLVEPNEHYTVSQFQNYANNKIAEIRSRGCVPFLVGGSGLYVDSVVFDYKFGPKADDETRRKLESMTLEDLHRYCSYNNIILPENKLNKRYVIRNIERNNRLGKRRSRPLKNTYIVGITTDKTVLKQRIVDRSDEIISPALMEEAKFISSNFGWNNESMTSNIYPLIKKYFNNEISLDDVKNTFISLDWKLAKRQLTWMKRNKFIHWFDINEARNYLLNLLAIDK